MPRIKRQAFIVLPITGPFDLSVQLSNDSSRNRRVFQKLQSIQPSTSRITDQRGPRGFEAPPIIQYS